MDAYLQSCGNMDLFWQYKRHLADIVKSKYSITGLRVNYTLVSNEFCLCYYDKADLDAKVCPLALLHIDF